MRHRLVVLFAIVAGAFAGISAAPATAPVIGTPVAYAHTCSPSYKHAIVGGAHKCLRSGQFCAKRYESVYRKVGYTCKPGSDGRLRLRKR